MAWTLFWDMSSGGSRKTDHHFIFIEAEIDDAIRVFYARFKRNPERVTCTCCGEDFSMMESATLEEATDYHRNRAGYNKPPDLMSIEEFEAQDDVLIIRALEISEDERTGDDPPDEGYVWQ